MSFEPVEVLPEEFVFLECQQFGCGFRSEDFLFKEALFYKLLRYFQRAQQWMI